MRKRLLMFSTALDIEHWTDFAEMAQSELLVIDETTTAASFRQAIRWNVAYYHLARGL